MNSMKPQWKAIIIILALVTTVLIVSFVIIPAIFLNPFRNSTKVYTISIENNEDFEDYGFQGTGTYQNPYRIENIELGTYEYKLRDYYTLLTIRNTTAHVLISNNTFIGCKIGIHLDYVKEGSILVQNNTFLGREFQVADMIFLGSVSIKSSESNNISIVENRFIGKLTAIEISESSSLNISKNEIVTNRGTAVHSISSSDILLDNNLVTDDLESVASEYCSFYFRLSLNFSIKNNVIDDGFIHIQNSEDFMLHNNTLKTEVDEIILLYISSAINVNISQNIFSANESTGLVVSSISNLKINNNTFDVRLRGLGIYNVQNSIISYNSFNNSLDYAIWNDDDDSYDIMIFHNNFFDNNPSGDSQCYNKDPATTWYNDVLSEGNFWSDLGSNSTYSIDGPAGSVDLYPLTSPVWITYISSLPIVKNPNKWFSYRWFHYVGSFEVNRYRTLCIENNFINGESIGFFMDLNNHSFTTQIGQFFLFNCTNITILNQDFQNINRGVFAGRCTNLTIADSTFDYSMKNDEYGRDGMYYYQCDNITFHNVSFIEGYSYTMYYLGCESIHVQNCSFYKTKESCISFDVSHYGEVLDNIFTIEYDVELFTAYTDLETFIVENNTIINF